ncbi:MAG: thioredoxin family protein [Gluconacetobacter diazotrophicus]|nr:thioredoxin family protein [Gluconacetobacter diazotrophicus]
MAAGASAAAPPPAGLPQTQPVPDAHPYDTAQDADATVAAALDRAKRDNKLVLIDLGANWCPDCRMLSGVLAMPDVKPWVSSRFETVMVDVDRFNHNMDVPARYGVKVKQIPTLLVVTPDGRLLNADGTLTLGDARHMTPQADVDLLASWAARAS